MLAMGLGAYPYSRPVDLRLRQLGPLADELSDGSKRLPNEFHSRCELSTTPRDL
jgi:hypothetical protein